MTKNFIPPHVPEKIRNAAIGNRVISLGATGIKNDWENPLHELDHPLSRGKKMHWIETVLTMRLTTSPLIWYDPRLFKAKNRGGRGEGSSCLGPTLTAKTSPLRILGLIEWGPEVTHWASMGTSTIAETTATFRKQKSVVWCFGDFFFLIMQALPCGFQKAKLFWYPNINSHSINSAVPAVPFCHTSALLWPALIWSWCTFHIAQLSQDDINLDISVPWEPIGWSTRACGSSIRQHCSSQAWVCMWFPLGPCRICLLLCKCRQRDNHPRPCPWYRSLDPLPCKLNLPLKAKSRSLQDWPTHPDEIASLEWEYESCPNKILQNYALHADMILWQYLHHELIRNTTRVQAFYYEECFSDFHHMSQGKGYVWWWWEFWWHRRRPQQSPTNEENKREQKTRSQNGVQKWRLVVKLCCLFSDIHINAYVYNIEII